MIFACMFPVVAHRKFVWKIFSFQFYSDNQIYYSNHRTISLSPWVNIWTLECHGHFGVIRCTADIPKVTFQNATLSTVETD